MDLGAIAMKEYSTLPKAPALLETLHQIVYCHIEDTHGGRGLTPQHRCSQCILQSQLCTEQKICGVLKSMRLSLIKDECLRQLSSRKKKLNFLWFTKVYKLDFSFRNSMEFMYIQYLTKKKKQTVKNWTIYHCYKF